MARKEYRRLQEWEEEAVAQGYLAGEKLVALAVEFDVDDSTVSRVARRRGFTRRTGPTVSAMVKARGKQSETKLEYARRRREIAMLRQARAKLYSERRA